MEAFNDNEPHEIYDIFYLSVLLLLVIPVPTLFLN